MNDVLSQFQSNGRSTGNFRDILSKPFSTAPLSNVDSDLDMILSKPSLQPQANERDRLNSAVDRFKSTTATSRPLTTQKSQNGNNDDDLLALINTQPDTRTIERSRRTSLEPTNSMTNTHFNPPRNQTPETGIYTHPRFQARENDLSFKNTSVMDNLSNVKNSVTPSGVSNMDPRSRRRDFLPPPNSNLADHQRDLTRFPTAKFSDKNVSLLNNDLSAIPSNNEILDDTKEIRNQMIRNARTLQAKQDNFPQFTSPQRTEADTLHPQFLAAHTVPMPPETPQKQTPSTSEISALQKALLDKESEIAGLKSENTSLKSLLGSKEEHHSQFVESLKKIHEENNSRKEEQAKREIELLRLTYEGVISQYKMEVENLNKIITAQNDTHSELKGQLVSIQAKIGSSVSQNNDIEKSVKAQLEERQLNSQIESKLQLLQKTMELCMHREQASMQKEQEVSAWHARMSEDIRQQTALLKSKEEAFNEKVQSFKSKIDEEQKRLNFERLKIEEKELEISSKLRTIELKNNNRANDDRELYDSYKQKLQELNAKGMELDSLRIELARKEELINKTFAETELKKQAVDVKHAEILALETDWKGKLEMIRAQQETLNLKENQLTHVSAQLEFQKQTISSINQSNLAFKVQQEVLAQKFQAEKTQFMNEQHSLNSLKETIHKIRHQQIESAKHAGLGISLGGLVEAPPTVPQVTLADVTKPILSKMNSGKTVVSGVDSINYEQYIENIYAKMKSYHLNN